MQLTIKQFRENLLSTINELVAQKDNVNLDNYKFVITPIKEHNVTYNSKDDAIRLIILSKKNLKNHLLNLDDVVGILSAYSIYPLWADVLLKEKNDSNYIFEIKTSMRFRSPSQLKNTDTGHPPFKSISSKGNGVA